MNTVVISCNYARSLVNFRSDLIRSIIALGCCQVVCIAPEAEDEWGPRIAALGARYVSVPVKRTGLSPIGDLRYLLKLFMVLKRERPDIVLSYNAKAVTYGSLAARLASTQDVFALVAGLGSIFRSNSNLLLKCILWVQYRIALSRCRKVIFQNPDDRDEFSRLGLVRHEYASIVNGSGVNLEHFTPAPLPDRDVFLFIGRLLRDKGLVEYMEAARRVRAKYPHTRCLVVGPFDTNPSALSLHDIEPYLAEGAVELCGATDDVRPYLHQCSVFILPSYHEGTPRSVLEAMATGRPVITTDAPGCRETVVDGKNGFLVPVKDANALAEKMIWMIENRDAAVKMGEASLKICREKYDVHLVNQAMLQAMGLTEAQNH